MAQSYTYTTEQINEMLNIGYDIMKHATSEVQNCTFPNAAIIDGMKAGKSPEDIASDAYNSIIKLDPVMDGYRTVDTYNSVAHPFHNAAQLMAGEIITKLKTFIDQSAATVEINFNDIPNDLFGLTESDLQENVTVSGTDVTGTLKAVANYTGFSSNVEEQSGHYIVVHVSSNKDSDFVAELIGGTKGPVTLDSDQTIVFLIKNTSQSIKVTATPKDGSSAVSKTYSLSGVTLA